MISVIARPYWAKEAACRGSSAHQFFLDESGHRRRDRDYRYEPAKIMYCARCDVMPECLKYALDNNITQGLWGGMTPLQRWRLKSGKTA